MRKRYGLMAFSIAGVLAVSLLHGCSGNAASEQTLEESKQETVQAQLAETESLESEGAYKEEGGEATPTFGRAYEPEDLETAWNADEVTGIVFDSQDINVTGDGVEVDMNVATIRTAGTYVLSGAMADGQVIVDAGEEDVVRLVFNGLELSNSQTAPVYGVQSKKIIITLEAGTENTIQDAGEYQYTNPEDDEPNAVIFSKDTLVLNGAGNLTVNGNYECGIRSKGDLTVISGNITIAALSDGLKGKDSVVIRDGNIQITSGKDGIKANNDTDPEQGYIRIDGGQVMIAAQDDGIQAETGVVINEGQITITQSDEGIAGLSVDINGGVVGIVSEDDGINAAATVENEQEKRNDQEGVYIRITGGEVKINAAGDGIDSNGDLYIEGGLLYMSGPTSGADSMFDYNGEALLNGGTVLAAGNAEMMQTFDGASAQPYLVVYFEEGQEAGTTVALQDQAGTVLASFTSDKSFNTVIVSEPTLENGKTYQVAAGENTVSVEISGIETSSGTPGGRGNGPRGGQGGERPAGDFQPPEGGFQRGEGEIQPREGQPRPARPEGD